MQYLIPLQFVFSHSYYYVMSIPHPDIEFNLVEGVIHATYQQGAVIDEAAARNIVDARKCFFGDNHYPAIIFIDGIKKITAGARRYLSSEEGIHGLVAVAMVSRSTMQYVLGNFCCRSMKHLFPSGYSNSPARQTNGYDNFYRP
ncbi:MAG: hypothetical protein QM664_12480 [Flavihumibacter sp.]